MRFREDSWGPSDLIFLLIFVTFSLIAEAILRTVTISGVAFSLALGVAVNLARRALSDDE